MLALKRTLVLTALIIGVPAGNPSLLAQEVSSSVLPPCRCSPHREDQRS